MSPGAGSHSECSEWAPSDDIEIGWCDATQAGGTTAATRIPLGCLEVAGQRERGEGLEGFSPASNEAVRCMRSDGYFPAQFAEIKDAFNCAEFRPDVVFTHARDDRIRTTGSCQTSRNVSDQLILGTRSQSGDLSRAERERAREPSDGASQNSRAFVCIRDSALEGLVQRRDIPWPDAPSRK